jgi:hypothetical protein
VQAGARYNSLKQDIDVGVDIDLVFSDNHRDRCRQPRWPVAAGVGRA